MFIFRHHRNGESLHTFKYNMVIWIVMWYTIGQPGLAEASLRGMVRLAGNTHFPLSFVTRITFDCLRRCLCITLCRFWFSPEHPVFQPRIFSVKMSDFTVRTCFVLFIVILFLTGTFCTFIQVGILYDFCGFPQVVKVLSLKASGYSFLMIFAPPLTSALMRVPSAER